MANKVNTARFLGQLPIDVLADFQQDQGLTNDCAAYSVGAALSLLRGGHRLDYDQIVRRANRLTTLHWLFLSGFFALIFQLGRRLWPGGPVTPRQQARLTRQEARLRDIPVSVKVHTGDPDSLVDLLSEPDTAVLVTLSWTDDSRPRIVYPDGTLVRFTPTGGMTILGREITYPFAAHTMLLAAYDPDREVALKSGSIHAPWGFINSWTNGGSDLFWMPDSDFQDAWSRGIIIGKRQMVVIRKKA